MNTPDISFEIGQIRDAYVDTAEELKRPSVMFKPSLERDGNLWSALYGSNIQEGVCGFGESPALAMADFDKSWFEELTPKQEELTPPTIPGHPNTYLFAESCVTNPRKLKIRMLASYDNTGDCVRWGITRVQFQIAVTSASEDLQGIQEIDRRTLWDRVHKHADNLGVTL